MTRSLPFGPPGPARRLIAIRARRAYPPPPPYIDGGRHRHVFNIAQGVARDEAPRSPLCPNRWARRKCPCDLPIGTGPQRLPLDGRGTAPARVRSVRPLHRGDLAAVDVDGGFLRRLVPVDRVSPIGVRSGSSRLRAGGSSPSGGPCTCRSGSVGGGMARRRRGDAAARPGWESLRGTAWPSANRRRTRDCDPRIASNGRRAGSKAARAFRDSIPERYTKPRRPALRRAALKATRLMGVEPLRPRLAVQTRKLAYRASLPAEHTFRLSAARARHHRLNGIVTCARLRLLGGPGPVQLATSSSRAGRSRTSSHDSSIRDRANSKG